MATDLDLRKIRCLDGLHYSFDILAHFYGELYPRCCRINEANENVIPALASAWGIIDAVHRIREIAQSIPGLNVKSLEPRVFLDKTSIAEEYRHYIQHLRGELVRNPPNQFPVWGSLSWVDPENTERTYIAMLGAQLEGTSYTGCVFDRQNVEWVSRVCLGIAGKSFNFDQIYSACDRFRSFVILFIENNASKEVTMHNKLPIMTVDFRTPDA